MSVYMDSATEKISGLSILSTVCSKNLSLDIRIIGEQSTEIYRSRFLGMEDDNGSTAGALVIEAPTVKGNVVLMRPGQDIKIIFVYQGTIHSFNTTIIGRGRHELNPTVTVSSLKLQPPASLSTGKIRSFYRLPIPHSQRLELSIGIYARQRGKIRRIRSREKAYITDIGGGGLGFRIAEGRSLLLSVHTRLFLSFRLPDDEDAIRLIGRICFSLRRTELREMFFGVQFVETDSDVQYKKNVDRILRFVAEQQRLGLSNRVDAVR
jgi:c-di-GMP-binding flagellar brake protein YcgR